MSQKQICLKALNMQVQTKGELKGRNPPIKTTTHRESYHQEGEIAQEKN